MIKRILSALLAVALVLVLAVPLVPRVAAVSKLSVSQELLGVLKTMEGFSRYPYWDYGQWTVGYGTRCPDDKLSQYQTSGIPEAEAEALLQQELDRFETAVNSFIDKHSLTLKQHQFDALVSFSYNCGEGWMSELTGYFNTAVRENGTADELLYGICLYSTAGGAYILAERRLCEANMYLYGKYQAYNSTAGVPDNLKYVLLDGNGGDTRYAIYGFDANRNSSINVAFSRIPTGTDAQGKPFVYTLEGWYTESGTKITKLNGSLERGQILYARWADPSGKVVSLPKGKTENMTLTINTDGLNVRKGPATYYGKVGTYDQGDSVTITETYQVGDYTWGKSTLGWFRLVYTNYEDLKAAQSQFPKNGVVTGTGVNIRTGPGTQYSKVSQKNTGDAVVITEEATGGSYRWGKMTDGYWICLDYVRYVEKVVSVTSVTVARMPDKTIYKQSRENLDLNGCVLLVTYDDGSTTALSATRSMVTSFSNATPGKTTVTLSCEGKTVSFQVTVVAPTITFLNWDGSVLSTGQYALGTAVTPPPDPERPCDGFRYYRFTGWDQPVTASQEDAVYTAVFEVTGLVGDANDDGSLDAADAGLILQYAAAWDVPLNLEKADVDGNGSVNANDAGLILQYIAGWDVTFR